MRVIPSANINGAIVGDRFEQIEEIPGNVVSPRPSPIVNHVLKGIVIMFNRLVNQVFISWRLMCLLGQGA